MRNVNSRKQKKKRSVSCLNRPFTGSSLADPLNILKNVGKRTSRPEQKKGKDERRQKSFGAETRCGEEDLIAGGKKEFEEY